MTPERWKRTEELYHAARARPPGQRAAYLAGACADDDDLRQEVESLLREPVSDDGLLGAYRTHDPADPPPDLTLAAGPGRSIGRYRLDALLGAGGMGEVYRARDEQLGRDVAIKILPPAFTHDPDRLARFEREARMLAALNHPGICAIYGTEEAAGVRLLVLELVEGETLADRLAERSRLMPERPGLPLEEALAIARQIADALEVAHDKGIVHRDLKPANIKITTAGTVKVLDFGLAKAIWADGDAPDLTRLPPATRHGMRDGALIGTAAYMSPEQARGLPVDARTDVWACGCVLYEMLTGRLAFAGDTMSDTIARILEREPDWSALPPRTPAHVRRLLVRCLAKNPRQRLRDVGDVRIELDAADEVLPGDSGSASLFKGRTRPLRAWLPWAALVAMAAGVGLWEARRASTADPNPLANARFSRLTNWEGTETGAEISPDGQMVAFVADRDGELDLWLTRIGSGVFVNLTREIPPLVVPIDIALRRFGFSGDGAGVWFGHGGERRNVLMPVIGGRPRPLLDRGTAGAAWSPDGARLVYFTADKGDSLFVADRQGADARQLVAASPGTHTHNPVWSSDGEWIYFVHGEDPNDAMDLWRVRPSGGSPERLTSQRAAVSLVAPIDARTLLYTARAPDGSGPWLWSLDVKSRRTRRVPGVEQYSAVAASRDGRRVVASMVNPTARLWRVPLLERPATEQDVQPYTLPAPTGRASAPRFRSQWFFYFSSGGDADGLWRAHGGEASEVWRDADGSLSGPPAVSPTGQQLAVVVRRDENRRLVVMSAEGTGLRSLAPSVDIKGAAGQSASDWSPDGTRLVAGGSDARGEALFVIPVAGGDPARLVDGEAVNPIWSPDGRLIVYAGTFESGQAPLLAVRPDGQRVVLPPVRVRPGGYRFMPDGAGLVYLPRAQATDFWQLDLATGQSRQLTRLAASGALRTFDITPDGTHIVFDRARENGDIVLIDLPR